MGDQTAHSPRWAAVWALAGRQHGAVSHNQLIELGLGHKAAIARRAGLPVPETRVIVNGVEVDFWFPELGLVVEADSLKYHRTPIKRLKDVRRDQEHFAADLVPLRFIDWQIAKKPGEVERTLRRVAHAIRARRAPTIAA